MLIKKNWKIGPHGFTVGLTGFFFFFLLFISIVVFVPFFLNIF